MPGKRGADVKVHNISVENPLWKAAAVKANAEGISVAEAIRRLLRRWINEE